MVQVSEITPFRVEHWKTSLFPIMASDTSLSSLFFSFDYGNVRYVMLNSEGYMGLEAQKITPDSDMYKWLDQDLASVDRKQYPWLVVALHRPLYCVENVRAAGRQCSGVGNGGLGPAL